MQSGLVIYLLVSHKILLILSEIDRAHVSISDKAPFPVDIHCTVLEQAHPLGMYGMQHPLVPTKLIHRHTHL